MTLGTTVDALIERVRRDAHLGSYGPTYSLASSVLASATSLPLNQSIQHITIGSTLAVDAEMFRVTDIHHDSNTVDVMPAAYGSATDAHAAGALVEADPRLPKASMIDWTENEIRSWDKLLFRISEVDVTASLNERSYELPVEDIDYVLDVRAEPGSSTTDDFGYTWTGDRWVHVEARLLRGMDAGDFASGFALQLTTYPRKVGRLRVTYAHPFDLTTLTTTTDLVADVGLQPQWLDILENGLRWRALSASMVTRTDWRATGMSRDAEEVSLIDMVRSVDMARSMRDRRLNEAALNIKAEYPYRSG